MKILGSNVEVIYTKVKQNMVADALSTKYKDVEALLFSHSTIESNWLLETRE